LAWFDSLQRSVDADSMTLIIRNVRYFGLIPQRYHVPEIDSLAKSKQSFNIQRTDALLTDAFFLLLEDLATGVSRRKELDSTGIVKLQHAIRSNTLLRTLGSEEPSYSQYHMLKSAIKMILDTATATVQRRLLQGEVSGQDPTMDLMRKIEINLQRWRSEKILSEEGTFIYINVPSFMLTVISDGNKVLESRVIVGAPKTPTPEISSQMECIVVYPYWHVPRKISKFPLKNTCPLSNVIHHLLREIISMYLTGRAEYYATTVLIGKNSIRITFQYRCVNVKERKTL
jgi:hypothetical protein